MERNLWASFTLTQAMFLILSVKSAAESVISVQGMRNINKPNKGDHTRKCEFKKKKKSKWKAETQSMKMKGKNPEFFIKTVFGLHIWMYLSCLIYTKNKHKSGDFYYFFFRFRQEANKKDNINSSFFSLLLCRFWLWWSDFKDFTFFPAWE